MDGETFADLVQSLEQASAHARWTYGVTVRPEPDDGGRFHAVSPDAPEAIASGDTEAEALAEMAEALAAAVRGRIRLGADLTLPEARAGQHAVTLPSELATEASAYVARRTSCGQRDDPRDGAVGDHALADYHAGRSSALDADEMKALVEATTPLAFWRRKGDLTLAALAQAVGSTWRARPRAAGRNRPRSRDPS